MRMALMIKQKSKYGQLVDYIETAEAVLHDLTVAHNHAQRCVELLDKRLKEARKFLEYEEYADD